MAHPFIPPVPNRRTMRLFTLLNETFILKGIPLLGRIPGFRPWSRAIKIHFTEADRARLRALVGPGKSVHFGPQHPATFQDWMIDKFITDRVAPECAHWASGDMVHGLGGFVRRMCLQNNIIAQGSDEPEKARAFAVAHAAAGKGVLLHPEGRVGWHNNFIGELLPGAVDMAMETYTHEEVADAYVAPILWKIIFRKDITPKLMREYRYAAKKLGHATAEAGNPAEGIFAIYTQLLHTHEIYWRGHGTISGSMQVRKTELQDILYTYIGQDLSLSLAGGGWRVLNRIKKWLRQNKDHSEHERAEAAVSALYVVLELNDHFFSRPYMTQEEAAEHLKRIRSSYCKGTMYDSINRFVPRFTAPCEIFIKVPEPFRVPETGDPEEISAQLRVAMQKELDDLITEVHQKRSTVVWSNPFHYR